MFLRSLFSKHKNAASNAECYYSVSNIKVSIHNTMLESQLSRNFLRLMFWQGSLKLMNKCSSMLTCSFKVFWSLITFSMSKYNFFYTSFMDCFLLWFGRWSFICHFLKVTICFRMFWDNTKWLHCSLNIWTFLKHFKNGCFDCSENIQKKCFHNLLGTLKKHS